VRAGLRNARAKGKRIGRPAAHVDASQIALLRASDIPWREIERRVGGQRENCEKGPCRAWQKPVGERAYKCRRLSTDTGQLARGKSIRFCHHMRVSTAIRG
jgi:hypothetical protein